MFSTPKDRYTVWTVNGHEIGKISIFSDVPRTFIRACVNFLQSPEPSFNVQFDGEGNDPGMAFIGDRFYTFVQKMRGDLSVELNDFVPVKVRKSEYYENQKFVEKMLREAVTDFKADFDEWVAWSVMRPDAAPAHIAVARENLKMLLELAEKTIKEKPYMKPDIYNLMSRSEIAVADSCK